MREAYQFMAWQTSVVMVMIVQFIVYIIITYDIQHFHLYCNEVAIRIGIKLFVHLVYNSVKI